MAPLLFIAIAASWSSQRGGDLGGVSFVGEVSPTITASIDSHGLGSGIVAHVVTYTEAHMPVGLDGRDSPSRREVVEVMAHAGDGIEFRGGEELTARRWRRDGWPEPVRLAAQWR